MMRSVWQRASRAARDPVGAANKILRSVGIRMPSAGPTSTSGCPDQVFQYYGRLAEAAGIGRLLLFLSFDCDTDEDIAAAAELDPWLRRLGVRATYAVPGRQLEAGMSTWRSLADSGAVFMNHGGLPHAAWETGGYRSITFYDQMSPDDVVTDIEEGDHHVRRVIGVAPRGFRAPHFGHYQRPDQLRLVHTAARRLGYSYCSTTVPSYALRHGPVVRLDGLVEIPCFGSWRAPETILDSWTYLADRRRYRLREEYYELFAETVEQMLEQRIPGVLTYYADPSHVIDQPPFHRAIELAVTRDVPSITGDELAAMYG